jgi:opacity protein-like surface antigen
MKKNLFFAAFVTMLCVAGFAQHKGSVEGGLSIGYNMSRIYDNYGWSDGGSGFNASGSIEYYFSSAWGIKAKVIYDQKGWNNGIITDIDTDTSYYTDFNLNYITIPVMANWHFAPGRNWYMNFGPYAGFLVGAKETRFDTDVKEIYNTTDFGLAYGIGVKIPVSHKIKIFFEYEGQSGLSNIYEEEFGTDVHNARSSFNVGVNFLMK